MTRILRSDEGTMKTKISLEERICMLEENEKRRRTNFMFAVCLILYMLGGIVIGVILDRVVLGVL